MMAELISPLLCWVAIPDVGSGIFHFSETERAGKVVGGGLQKEEKVSSPGYLQANTKIGTLNAR